MQAIYSLSPMWAALTRRLPVMSWSATRPERVFNELREQTVYINRFFYVITHFISIRAFSPNILGFVAFVTVTLMFTGGGGRTLPPPKDISLKVLVSASLFDSNTVDQLCVCPFAPSHVCPFLCLWGAITIIDIMWELCEIKRVFYACMYVTANSKYNDGRLGSYRTRLT